MPSKDRKIKPYELKKGLKATKKDVDRAKDKLKKEKYNTPSEVIEDLQNVSDYLATAIVNPDVVKPSTSDFDMEVDMATDDTDDEDSVAEVADPEKILMIHGDMNKVAKKEVEDYLLSFSGFDSFSVGDE